MGGLEVPLCGKMIRIKVPLCDYRGFAKMPFREKTGCMKVPLWSIIVEKEAGDNYEAENIWTFAGVEGTR